MPTTVPDLAFAPVESRTLKGDRSYQQDACDWLRAVDPDTGLPVIVAAVADGCGSGAGSGRIAKDAVRLAIRIAATYGAEHLDRAIDAAREIIDERRPRRGRNDNTTLVLAYYDAASLRVAWVGDSRAYALTADGTLHALTRDHNLAPYAPNQLTRALLGSVDHRHGDAWEGCESHTPQVATPLLGVPFQPSPARVLLCTDGVCGALSGRGHRRHPRHRLGRFDVCASAHLAGRTRCPSGWRVGGQRDRAGHRPQHGRQVMTDTPNPAADFVKRQAARRREHLARDAQYLADDAARYAASVTKGERDAGGASRLAQAALQIALAATRLDEMAETIAYLSHDPEGH